MKELGCDVGVSAVMSFRGRKVKRIRDETRNILKDNLQIATQLRARKRSIEGRRERERERETNLAFLLFEDLVEHQRIQNEMFVVRGGSMVKGANASRKTDGVVLAMDQQKWIGDELCAIRERGHCL